MHGDTYWRVFCSRPQWTLSSCDEYEECVGSSAAVLARQVQEIDDDCDDSGYSECNVVKTRGRSADGSVKECKV